MIAPAADGGTRVSAGVSVLLDSLPNPRRRRFVRLPWTGRVNSEPPRKLFMEYADDVVNSVGTGESRKNRVYFRSVFVCRRAARQQANRIGIIDRASNSLSQAPAPCVASPTLQRQGAPDRTSCVATS
jgi:hypothetical protein